MYVSSKVALHFRWKAATQYCMDIVDLWCNGTSSTVDTRWKTATGRIRSVRTWSTITTTFTECTALTADSSVLTSCSDISTTSGIKLSTYLFSLNVSETY